MPWDLRSLRSTLWPVTPLTVTLSGSFDEARQMLRFTRHCSERRKALTNLVYRFATRARRSLRRVHYLVARTANGQGDEIGRGSGWWSLARLHWQNGSGKRRKERAARLSHALARAKLYLTSTPLTRTARSRKRSNRSSMGRSSYWRESEEIFERLKGYLWRRRWKRRESAFGVHQGWSARRNSTASRSC